MFGKAVRFVRIGLIVGVLGFVVLFYFVDRLSSKLEVVYAIPRVYQWQFFRSVTAVSVAILLSHYAIFFLELTEIGALLFQGVDGFFFGLCPCANGESVLFLADFFGGVNSSPVRFAVRF